MKDLEAAKRALLNLGFCDASENGTGDPEVIAINKAILLIPRAINTLKACVREFGDENPDLDWAPIEQAREIIEQFEAA